MSGANCLLAGGQDQFKVGKIVNIGPDRPRRPMDGLNRGQADRQARAEGVEVGIVVAPVAVAEDPKGKAPPLLGMDRAFEEGAARQRGSSSSAPVSASVQSSNPT